MRLAYDSSLTCPLNGALSSPFPFLTLCVSGYEEVVRIPKGSVFIHIQELNISLNYLGKTGLALSCVFVPVGSAPRWLVLAFPHIKKGKSKKNKKKTKMIPLFLLRCWGHTVMGTSHTVPRGGDIVSKRTQSANQEPK